MSNLLYTLLVDEMKQAVNKKSIFCVSLFFLLYAVVFAANSFASEKSILAAIADEKGEFACLSANETELFNLINQYRRSNGLPAISNSRSLNKVARMHAVDLHLHNPQQSQDARGLPCNLHSWSKNGFWSPVCYTSDHYYADKMMSKASEITRRIYNDLAYENVYMSSVDLIFPRRVLQAWQESRKHRELVLEQEKWTKTYWQSLGVGFYKNIATIWVGSMPDPLGPMKPCTSGK